MIRFCNHNLNYNSIQFNDSPAKAGRLNLGINAAIKAQAII